MGAIAGFLGEGDARALDKMTALMRHRGKASAWVVPNVAAIAHVAPVPHVASHGGKADATVCVFDGSLYNAAALAERFCGDAKNPADVVARGFRKLGPKVFSLLDGPFVVAVHAAGELHLARDPLGEKPLYYTSVRGGFLFASEIKAFVDDRRFVARPSMLSLSKLLVFSFIPGTDSAFEGVCELPPGQRLVVGDDHEPKSTTYWDLAETTKTHDEARCVREIRELTRAAVDKRLEGRSKVGAFLSGGIDSSAVVAVLAEKGVEVTAFSAGFGHGQPNELMYARLVAQHCGPLVTHQVIDVEPDQFLDLLPQIMWQLDDPLCDCITVPNYILAREASKQVDLVFNGEGGDPLFGGPKNKFLILGEWYAFLGGYDRARAYLSSYHKFFDYLGALCTPEMLAHTGGQKALEDWIRPWLENADIKHFLNRLMHVNIKLKGGQNILVKVDKMLGANGVRAASPLFDQALTELSFAIPPNLKRKGDVEKYVFKKAMEDSLPRAVVYRKKAGMGVPLNFWFKVTALREYTMDLLTSQRCKDRGYFEPKFVDNLIAGKGGESSVGQNRSGELLWMLLAIELWHRVYIDGERPR